MLGEPPSRLTVGVPVVDRELGLPGVKVGMAMVGLTVGLPGLTVRTAMVGELLGEGLALCELRLTVGVPVVGKELRVSNDGEAVGAIELNTTSVAVCPRTALKALRKTTSSSGFTSAAPSGNFAKTIYLIAWEACNNRA